ncbi:DNA-binding transcriptional regulator, LysR family [Terriglobus roseus]|uniref:DNA-binding transcriptional regulator, LysR family n=1 Tax=Terriglobus roseus TaxID=392734 RepID=A0A1G7PVE9_9BACT|nr:DNA-binding transcriptional regulator, LysR family [Terriglobus roseus]
MPRDTTQVLLRGLSLQRERGERVDIDDLRILNSVAKHGSMNRAAAALHMVQSSVTARIRQLEDELGVSLFVRHSRGVRLSEAGERLLSYSGRIDALFQEAVAAVKEDGVPKGTLRIGSTEPTVSFRLPSVLAAYAKRYPAVSLTVTTGNSSELIRQVVDQSLDGAFVAGPVANPLLTEEPMFREELALVTQASTRSIDDLRSAQEVKAIVLAEGCSYGELINNVLSGYGIKHQVLPLASFDAIRSFVQSGIGITVLPKEILAASWKDAAVAVHELPAAMAQVETVFIRRADSSNRSALEAFLLLSRASSNLDG